MEIARVEDDKVRGKVGGGDQTPESYRAHVQRKFPADWYGKLEEAFRRVLQTYPPKRLNSKLTYDLYDQWKKLCAAGRLVDLDKLLEWCNSKVTAKS